MNRAAESAAPTARKLVVDAVSSMTIEDALGVLRGGDTAATDYLRKKTEPSLTQGVPALCRQGTGELRRIDGAGWRARTRMAPDW